MLSQVSIPQSEKLLNFQDQYLFNLWQVNLVSWTTLFEKLCNSQIGMKALWRISLWKIKNYPVNRTRVQGLNPSNKLIVFIVLLLFINIIVTRSLARLSLAPLCLATLGAPLPGHHVSSQAILIMIIIIATFLLSCRLVGNILHSFALVKYSQLSRRLLRDWSDGSKRDLCSPTWQPACWSFPLWPGGRK